MSSLFIYFLLKMEKNMDDIANRFIEMRKNLGFNKSQLSQYIKSTPSIIGEIESGKREPSKNILMKLLSLYNVNINWLLSGEGEMFIGSGNRQAHATLSPKTAGSEEDNDIQATNGGVGWKGLYSKYLLEDSTDGDMSENMPKEVDLIKIDNIINKRRETAVLIPEIFNIYREKLTAIAITSDDMQPTISKNAIVLCNDFGFIGSGIYTVKINGVYSVKRISLKNTDSYIMACDNKLYEPFEIATNDKKLEIIGLVRVAINIL